MSSSEMCLLAKADETQSTTAPIGNQLTVTS